MTLTAQALPLEIGARGWLTTTQAGAALGVSAKSVARWCEAGKLNAARLEAGWWRVKPADLEQFALAHGLPLNWGMV